MQYLHNKETNNQGLKKENYLRDSSLLKDSLLSSESRKINNYIFPRFKFIATKSDNRTQERGIFIGSDEIIAIK